MIDIENSLSVAPNASDIQGSTEQLKGVPDVIGMFGGVPSILPPQEDYDIGKQMADLANKPATLETQMQATKFDWEGTKADRYVNSDYYKQEGFLPYAGNIETPAGPYEFNEQRYGQIQTFGNTMKKGAGGFWNLTKATFSDAVEGEGRLINTLFNWGSDQTWKERLMGSPAELAIKDKEQEAIFNKYAIFHTAESNQQILNKQFLGDIMTQAGFTVGPMAEFLGVTALTMGVGEIASGFAKGTQFAAKAATLGKNSARAFNTAEAINDMRRVGSMTANTPFFTEMVGGLKNTGRWAAKQLNPLTGIEDISHAVEAGTGAWNIGITTVGAAKRAFGQANMSFNEARFEAAGTYGQMVGEMAAKYERQYGEPPTGAELEKIQRYAYGAATDNFIVNSAVIMGMNTLQFGNMFSKFSSSSKLLREAIETGSDTYAVTGKIGEKTATRVYRNAGIFANPIRTFNTVRKDFGLGTALYTAGKRAVGGTAAKFELTEGIQELLQTGSDISLRDYYTNLYDGRKDLEGADLADVNWQKGMADQYNLSGWKTFLMGAVTGMLISPMQASVMYATKKGYGRINDAYKQEVDGYEKAQEDNVDLQNTFYKNVAKGLNPVIANWKIQGQAGKLMEEGIQNGDKYTFHNGKDDSFAAAVSAAIKTNTLPSLVDTIKEYAENMSPEEVAEAFPAIVPGNKSTTDVKNYLTDVANQIEQYYDNWERLKERFGHLVMPEVYKANKEEYSKALLAKRALDEAIELLATTDYKATQAIKRAADIRSKVAGIGGLGSSAAEAFDVLLSTERTKSKIAELLQLSQGTGSLPTDKGEKSLIDTYTKQIGHLITWNTLIEGHQDDMTEEVIDQMSDAFENYVIAHNSLSGPYAGTVDRSALKDMFRDMGQYMALNRDTEHYIEAMNILADPKNFIHSYGIISSALQGASDALKKENIKESKEKIDKEFGREEEPIVSEPESPTDEDVPQGTKDIADIEEIEEPISEQSPVFTTLVNYPIKIAENNIDDTITIVQDRGVDRKGIDNILNSVSADVLREGMTLTVTRNEPLISIAEIEPGRYKVLDNRRDDKKNVYPTGTKMYTQQEAENKKFSLLAPGVLRDKKDTNPYVQIHPQTYHIKVFYDGVLLGRISEPTLYTFTFNGQTVPAEQLTLEQFVATFYIPADRDPEGYMREFMSNYTTGVQFKNAISALIGDQDTLELRGQQIPFIPVVSKGSLDFTPEWAYNQRRTLRNALKGSVELLGIVDIAQDRVVEGDDDLIKEVKDIDPNDVMGNYRIKLQLANGDSVWIQGKAIPLEDTEVIDIVDRANREALTVRGNISKSIEPDIVTWESVNRDLNRIFITTTPATNTTFRLALSSKGALSMTSGSRYIGEKGVEYINKTVTFKEWPTDIAAFRTFLGTQAKKLMNKLTPEQMEIVGIDKDTIKTIIIERNNLRENIAKDADVDTLLDTLTVSSGITKDVKLTYKTAEPTVAELTDIPGVEEVVSVEPPIEGGGVYIVSNDISDRPPSKILIRLNTPKEDRMAKKANKRVTAKKVLSPEDATGYSENIQRFRDWVRTNLPDSISVDTDTIIENLHDQNTTIGEFLIKMLDIGQLSGVIRTSPDAQYKYHEAFHSVFRMLLPQNRIDRLLSLASHESPVSGKKLQDMRALHPDYAAMDDNELTERYYEEYLADRFDAWKKDRSIPTSSTIKGFFAKVWDWIKEVVARLTKRDITRLFHQIDRGAFRNVQVQHNQFTRDTDFITTISSAKKVIPLYYQDIVTPDGTIQVMKYLPQSTADTLTSTIAALFFKDIQTKGQYNKREILNSIMDKYEALYDPDLQHYQDIATSIEDGHARELWQDRLDDLYFLFYNEDARQDLMEAVDVHLRIAGIKQDLEDDQYESLEEEVGPNNTENFDRNKGTAGDYNSLAKYLRQYIAGTTIDHQDEYGNKEFVDGTPLVQAVNANYIYNGLLKILSNTTDSRSLIGKMMRFYENGGNEATNAFIERLTDDTGLQVDPDGSFRVTREGQEILIQQILKGFNQFEVDHLFTLVKGNNEYITMAANRENAATNQISLWNRAWEQVYWNKKEMLSVKEKGDFTIAAYTSFSDLEKVLSTTKNSVTREKIAQQATDISNRIKNLTGIYLHPNYIKYSIVSTITDRKKWQQDMIDDYSGVSPITKEDLNTLRPIFRKDGENIFSKDIEKTQTILTSWATGNSYFDETVNTMSYVTADGESVYSHQLPSYYNIEIYKLNDPAVIAADKRDIEKNTFLLDDKDFLYLSETNKIRPISTDGIRKEDIDKSPGTIYGDFNGRAIAAYMLGMYGGAVKVRRGNGYFWNSAHMIRVVEAKNSAPFIALPVRKRVLNGRLSETSLDIMVGMVKGEVARIERVKKEIKDRKVKKLDGYHTGEKRGLHLFETTRMVGSMKEDIENSTIDEPALREQLNNYWLGEVNKFAELLYDNGLIAKGPKGEYINRLAPSYLFKGIPDNEQKQADLNLIPGDFIHNLSQVMINDYLNTDGINRLLNGNEAKLFKDGVDQNKRSGAAAMGPSIRVDVTCPRWGIDSPLTTIHHVTYRSHKEPDMFNNNIDTDDGQMYITEKALRYMLFGFGKLNQTQVDILDKLAIGEQVTAHEFFGAGGLKEKGPFNSYKLVHYDGETYLKCSAVPLFRDMVSIYDNGTWLANPEYQQLHDLLDKMEEQERAQDEQGNNIVVFAHPVSASKTLKKGVVDNISDISSDSYNEIPADYTRLQLENPSNKIVITDPTQAKQQIMAEQDDSAIVSFFGVDKSIGEIKDIYMRSISQRKTNNWNNAANGIFTLQDAQIELGKSIDLKKVTPKLGQFLLHAQETLMATGTDSHTLGFFEVDKDGQPIYNHNFPSILPKFTELFLSYFSKGVLSEKVPGASLALVSDYGIMKFKKVTSIWKEGDTGYIPEYAGQPRTWQVITTKEVKNNPSYYANIAKRWDDNKKRTYIGVQEGDIILDSLRHNYPKYDSTGKYLGRFSEFMMPAHFEEVMNKIPESLRYNFGVRIPSDDKHSYITAEYVDTLPVQLGSVAIFPRELIRISGADFDIDKLYMSFMDTYSDGNNRVAYGSADTIQGQFEEYIIWQAENNKVVKDKVKELQDSWHGVVLSAAGEDRRILLTALKALGLPSTVQEFIDKGGPDLNNGVQTNLSVRAKISMFNNENISGDKEGQPSILNQSTDTKILKDIVGNLKKVFSGMLADENRNEEDKKGIQKILSNLNDPVADINGMLGKMLAYTNNKEGSRNIGGAVNSMLSFSLLTSNKVVLTSTISFGGRDYKSFIDTTTSDGIRKFAQISAMVNAMTDNAKDPLASKLGLNIEAVGYVSTMMAIGIPAESAILLVLQPVIKEYFRQVQNTQGQLKTLEEAQISSFSILPGMIDSYKDVKGQFLNDSKLLNNIASDGSDRSLQLSALLLLKQVKDISDLMRKTSTVMGLSKGLASTFMEVDKIKETLSDIKESEIRALISPVKPPFFIYDILSKDNKIIATDIDIMNQTLELSKVIFTERTDYVKGLTEDILSMMRVSPGKGGDAFRKQLRDDIISYLSIAAYKNTLRRTERTGTLETLQHGLIYSNNGVETIVQRVNRLRNKLKESTQGSNYLVDRYLFLITAAQSKGNINEVQANIWTKISQAVQERLGSAFMDLYSNSHTDVSGEQIDTHSDAIALFHYLLVKDGGQFKNNSFIRYVPNVVFSELLQGAGDINELLATAHTNKDFEYLFNMSPGDVRQGFIDSYGQHINNKQSLKTIPTYAGQYGERNPDGQHWNGPDEYIVQLPATEIKGLFFGGLEVVKEGDSTSFIFPRYIRKESFYEGRSEYTLLQLSEVNNEPIDNGVATVEGYEAVYKRTMWKGSFATWKGAGVFGPLPGPSGISVSEPIKNPGTSPTAPVSGTPGYTEQATQLSQQLPWKEYLNSQGLTTFMGSIGGVSQFLIQDSNTGTVESIYEYSAGRATTPEQLYEVLTGSSTQEQPTSDEDNDATWQESGEPVVPLQTLSGEQWKDQLSAIHKEKGITRPEREWTQEALNFRNTIRGTMSDQDIINKIKECI